jgi:GntR family transcriptional regulator, rspAB operon transcriptional repressor
MTESLSKQAYRRIRRMILTLDLAPGAVVNEASLMTTIKIGRTPIREALQRLESEHFITVVPRKGMFVAGLTVGELPLLYETRAVLEPYAARLAAQRGTEVHWRRMEAALRKAARINASDRTLLDVDRTCHEVMWEASGNRFLTGTLDALYAQSERVWHMYVSGVHDMRGAVDEHSAMLDAFRAGDADRAADLATHHVVSFQHEIINTLSAL